jgi:hypothetical protein
VAEWFKAPVLKTGRGFRSLVSSNLTPSASQVESAAKFPLFLTVPIKRMIGSAAAGVIKAIYQIAVDVASDAVKKTLLGQ